MRRLHGVDAILFQAFCKMTNGEHLIATGNSERGAATTIKLWAASGTWITKKVRELTCNIR